MDLMSVCYAFHLNMLSLSYTRIEYNGISMAWQGYGMTETTGIGARMVEVEETKRFSSVGKLAENMEAKIVDPVTGKALSPGQKGELWLRGPTIMKGKVFLPIVHVS